MRRNLVGLGVVAALVLTACSDGDTESSTNKGIEQVAETPDEPESTVLEDAWQQCIGEDEDDTIELEDDGYALLVDTRSEYGDLNGFYCLLDELDVSRALESRIESTTAMQGVQDDEEDGLEYVWSYHPDNGVNMTIEVVED